MLMGAGHTAQGLFAPAYLAAEAAFPPHSEAHKVDLPDPAAVLKPASASLPPFILEVLVQPLRLPGQAALLVCSLQLQVSIIKVVAGTKAYSSN